MGVRVSITAFTLFVCFFFFSSKPSYSNTKKEVGAVPYAACSGSSAEAAKGEDDDASAPTEPVFLTDVTLLTPDPLVRVHLFFVFCFVSSFFVCLFVFVCFCFPL